MRTGNSGCEMVYHASKRKREKFELVYFVLIDDVILFIVLLNQVLKIGVRVLIVKSGFDISQVGLK